MATMKRTTTMNWDGLGCANDDEDDQFFDSNNRISTVITADFHRVIAASSASSDEDDDEFEDPRMSFASCISTATTSVASRPSFSGPCPFSSMEEYDIWMAAPVSIKERRKKLLQGMGLTSSKELLRVKTSREMQNTQIQNLNLNSNSKESSQVQSSSSSVSSSPKQGTSNSPSLSPHPVVLVRSRSDGDIDTSSFDTKLRKEQLIGNVSKQRLTKTSSALSPCTRLCGLNCNSVRIARNGGHSDHKSTSSAGVHHQKSAAVASGFTDGNIGAFFLIKNLDTGNEFIVKEFGNDGMWNRLSDLQTGRQLTMEEFEKSVGYSPVVKELMRRENVGRIHDGNDFLDRKASVLAKSFRYSKRRGVSFLKSINRVANPFSGFGSANEKERETHGGVSSPTAAGGGGGKSNQHNHHPQQQTEWVRVRQQGKSYKEFTALRLCQEIHAHEGSIWTIKFNPDGRYLASAGEDRIIHIWEVQECEIAALRPPEELGLGADATPLHPMFCPSPDRSVAADRPPLPDFTSLEKKKKGKNSNKRGNGMPDHVQLPETLFALLEKPVCSFEGHLDDVLDLSWSRSQLLLLSSSMDKTVRLWDLETQTCLKLFAHNDYVTCIQFNPTNDDYFISGSLDAKVRIWNIPGRRVVDWTDLHEMVTTACYTPDGQGAAVGSHKGNCRMYSTADGKLNQISQFDIQAKKKADLKKITGFQFLPENPNEVLVTSADSRIRIYDGSEVIQKFRGFQNTSSQIAASFSPDGKYIICASEDSRVYIWKREEPRVSSSAKTKVMIDTRAHEYFPCKDVSVAIPWPGNIKYEPPIIQLHTKKHTKRAIASHSSPASACGSPTKDESKRLLPPIPTKNNNNNNSNHSEKVSCYNSLDKAPNSPESDQARISRIESERLGESFSSSTGASIKCGDSPSISSNHGLSPSWSPGWSWSDGGSSQGGDGVQATAWGLVIVTAGLGGEIRVYQNLGLPLRVGRQTNLFRDLT